MRKLTVLLVLLTIVLTACSAAPTTLPTLTPIPNPTATPPPVATDTVAAAATTTPKPSNTPTPLPTLNYPPEGYGPDNFPSRVDPLTGLTPADPALLQRRPLLVQVSNLPRDVRPQWGLSLADIVFEFYTEEGGTRFAALFYGNDAPTVGPIRSGRFIDGYLVDGYKSMFAFGSAYQAELDSFMKSDFANRTVVEAPYTPLKRYDPNGLDYLIVNTADLTGYAKTRGLNTVQTLNNMLFKLPAPAAGQQAQQVFVDYSRAVYSRWDYDPSTGKYLRFSDNADITDASQTEQYLPLTDRLNNQQLSFDNVVVVFVNHNLYSPGIYDIQLTGSGDASAFRDGQVYQVKWQRAASDVISLTNPDGSPFPFKPGTTFFQIVGLATKVTQNGQSWRFAHQMP